MSLREYEESKDIYIKNHSFYALIMTAMRQADSMNFELLRAAFPETYVELQRRYDSPGG